MAKSTTPPADLAKYLHEAQTHVAALRDIRSICVMWSWTDAASIMEAGAVLLGFSTVKDDEEGDGFRFLLGLPKNVTVTAHLGHFFPEVA